MDAPHILGYSYLEFLASLGCGGWGMHRFRYIAKAGALLERGVILAENKTDALRRLQATGCRQIRLKSTESTTGKLLRRLFPLV